VSATCERRGAGYRLRIVLAPQAFDAAPVAEFNFDWGVNDADRAKRESQLMWSGTRDNWGDARGFGRMRAVR
jgi:hypothetical protein